MNEEVKKSEKSAWSEERIKYYQKRYRSILDEGKKECPLSKKIEGKRGKQKQTKSRNLLDRLVNFEDDVLRFIKESIVTFTKQPR
jgi:transposase